MPIREEDMQRALKWTRAYNRLQGPDQKAFLEVKHEPGVYACEKCGKTLTDCRIDIWQMVTGPCPAPQSASCPNTALIKCPAKISFAEDALKNFTDNLNKK